MSRYSFRDAYELKAAHIRDIRPDVLGPDGRMRILPAAYWRTTSISERGLFGHNTGIYAFPTLELVEHLKEIIDGRFAIEIGAGNGVLAEALGITATDSFQQQNPKYAEVYADIGSPTVPYGPNVQKLTAYDAVRTFRPKVVLACWVTHKFDKNKPWLKGNEVGVDEADVLDHCEEYVFIGNLAPNIMHSQKPIFQRATKTVTYPDFLFSRAREPKKEALIRWPGQAR